MKTSRFSITPFKFGGGYTSLKKREKKSNRKGFSLVELIVVLVIMAILSAALIPSLIGYISKTKEQNVQSECQSAVTAAQTISSGIYASTDGTYKFTAAGASSESSVDDVTDADGLNAIKALAEVPGTVSDVIVTADGLITQLKYTGEDGTTICWYSRPTATSPGTYSKDAPSP